MVFLPEIIEQINGVIAARLSKYPRAEYAGLVTTSVRYDNESKTVTFPSVIDLGGASVQAINFSVKPAFIVYHRAMGTNFTPSTQTRSYGDGDLVNVVANTTIRLVCAGNRKDIDIQPEELAMFIADALPSRAEMNKVKNITIGPNSIAYDARTVFNTEFQGIPFNVGPERFIFSIQYTIEGSYLKGCLKTCNC